MGRLRFLTAGESHGQALVGIMEGMPAGFKLDREGIDKELKRRQVGYGRGGRMKIESDRVEILSGVRFGKTLGSPIAMLIRNRDWENWQDRMAVWEGEDRSPVRIPRPGHADLAGAVKFDHRDLRNVFERASARETAMRVALSAVVRQMLGVFDIWIGSHVVQVGDEKAETSIRDLCEVWTPELNDRIRDLCVTADASDVRCGDTQAAERMRAVIRGAKEEGDSVGGMFEVAAIHVPAGLGHCGFWERRLDAAIAAAFMGIPGIKSVEIGLGSASAERSGSGMHDPIVRGDEGQLHRSSNRAGGIEGGMSNGEPIVVRAAMKPIPTLKKSLPSVDLEAGRPAEAHKERSDVCAVPASSVIGEAMLSLTLGQTFCERYGGDSLDQIRRHYDADREASPV